MKVSVILPTYNEAGNIISLIQAIIQYLPPEWDYEIIVVDDNSPDGTYQIVKEVYQENPTIIPILRTAERGLANSIRTGIESSSGEKILVMDTDFTHSPDEIPKMLHVSKVFDIVSGSRFCAGGSMDSLRHYLASLLYNWFIRIVLRTQIQDNLGGFFIIDRHKLETLPLQKIFFGYGDYYFRLLHFAQKSNLSILELPAKYHSRKQGKSKSNFAKLLITYTAALIRFRIQL